MAALGLLLFGIVVFGAVALFVWAPVVDMRTGSGYGLCILLSLHLACTILVVGTVAIVAQVQPQPAGIHNPSVTIWLVFYFVPAVYGVAFTLIGAVLVAGKAGHWGWIGGFVV